MVRCAGSWGGLWAILSLLLGACSGEEAETEGGSPPASVASEATGEAPVDEGGEPVSPYPDWKPPQAVDPEDRVLVLHPDQLQLGQLENGKEYPIELEFENRSDRMVSIQGVNTSCSCLKLSPDDRRVRPGERTKLTGVVRNKGNQAQARIRVTVITNSIHQRMVTGTVVFWSETQFLPVPRRMDLGALRRGSEVREEFRLQYRVPSTHDPLEVEPVVLGGLPLSLEKGEVSSEVDRDARSVTHCWTVVVDTSELSDGDLEGGLKVASPGFVDLVVPVSLRIVGDDWYLDNRSIHMGLVAAGDTKNRVFKVYYSSELGRPEVQVSSEVEGLVVRAEVVDDVQRPHVLLDMDYTAPAGAGAVEGSVVLRASFEEEPIVIGFGARVRD